MLYNDAAMQAWGLTTEAEMEMVFEETMDQANMAFDISSIELTVRLVHFEKVWLLSGFPRHN